jgi:small-conductance mechanosensitive channel
VRASVNVGVAYGSPVRKVEELLRDVLEEHKSVLKVPQPVVLFSDFGDNALMFQLLFWVRVRRIMDMRRIQSDVRFLISDSFEQADITIAFPQRDVHLDTIRPLEVRVTK